MKKLTIIFTLIALVIITACGGEKSMEAKQAKLEKLKAQHAELGSDIKTLEEEIKNSGVEFDTKQKVVNVSYTTITPTKYQHFIDVQGTVDGDENAIVSAKVPGIVTKVSVVPGSSVKAGQLLAELDANAIIKQLDAMEINYKLVKELYEKQKSLWDRQIGSEIQFKQAKTNKESLEEQIGAMREQLKMYRITSLVNGTVDMVNLKVGQTAAPGMPYFSIVNYNKLKVKANVAEIYASKIKDGNPVVVTFPDINKSLTSTINYSGRGINLVNRTIGIDIKIPSSNDFIPNMVANVKIIDYVNNNAFIAPINCIQYTEDKASVFVIVNEGGKNIARKRDITVGSTYNNTAEIKNGLVNGDKIVTIGYNDLNDGELVKF